MTIPAILAVICALAYLGFCARPESRVRSGIKTASVALLAVAALLSGGPVLLAVALGFCALGDWWLSRPGERAFMAGVVAFATGHLAYVALFLTHPLARPARWAEMPRPLILAALVVLGLTAARLIAPKAGALRGAVLGYIPVILSMGAAVLVLPPSGALVFAAPAAALFITSDLVLAGETFLLPEHHPARALTPYAIWATYWLAQLGFLVAFA